MDKKQIYTSKDIIPKIYNLLLDTGWDQKMKLLLLGNEMKEIIEFLIKESSEGRKFTPTLKYLFNAFIKCKYNDTNVVFIGQDPYPQLEVADGLCFSCSRRTRIEVSLQIIYEALNEKYPRERSGDLSEWAEQGILLLNSALTTRLYQVGTHYNIWKAFISNIIEILEAERKPIYVFFGKKAAEFETLIKDSDRKIIVAHPASAAYSKTGWDCEDLFERINIYLEKNQKNRILW